MVTIHAGQALTADGWQENLRIVINHGRIAELAAGVAPKAGDERHEVVVPGMPNLHSHAFQRGMAGLAEIRGPSADSFWSWRDVMYRYALAMSPDQLEAVAAQLYVEMLESGFTRVGEFHYLHHDRDGRRYDDVAEMSSRIAAAASTTGIALTLLPVFYAHGAFGGAAPGDGQRRFIHGLDQYAQLLDRCGAILMPLDGSCLGVAPHSLRAVTPDELQVVAGLLPGSPVHIHVAEQTKEVDDCLVWSGKRPVQWLLDHAAINDRWCLVHATHMDDREVAGMAQSGAVAGLCPVTEANLGDGIFRASEFLSTGGAFGIGSDSNVLIGIGDELRQLEYSQRLRDMARNVLGSGAGSTGRALFDGAVSGGALALGQQASGIHAGASADLVALYMTNPAFAGRNGDQILDSWIFAAHRAVDSVWVGGRKLVSQGRHVQREEIARRFTRVMSDLAGAI